LPGGRFTPILRAPQTMNFAATRNARFRWLVKFGDEREVRR